MANQYEEQARERKAQAIARKIWLHLPPECRTNATLAATIADATQPERDAWARCAGQHEPSEETWARTCEILAEKVADERHWHGLTDRHAVPLRIHA